ncbi:hypothetical protein PR002_g17462 [Phytophthora rubi]|uniref:Uncharacterized protein n=1 Tax=Phytophthora rubi TaxID=129364 RepID=A0A6A3K9B0_9STRA|nr:hypothetical protein PR002_g17462 [Phytophthora rubi]
MNGPRRICAKPSFQNLLCRANIGPQGNQAQRRSGKGGPPDNRAQRDVVLELQQGPQGNRAQRRWGGGYFHYNKGLKAVR